MGNQRTKNPAAVALGQLGGKARAKALTAEQRSNISRLATAARNNILTAAERKRIARLASRARWNKK